jgi:hypothetical protein
MEERGFHIPSFSEICTLMKMVSSSGSKVPVIVISVLLVGSGNEGGDSTTFLLDIDFGHGMGNNPPLSDARKGSNKSSPAGNLFEAVSKHFPTNRRASMS